MFPEIWSTGYSFPHNDETLRRIAISTESFFVKNFSELASELDMAIATCNYPSPYPDCNGHSTLFDGVVYVPNLCDSRDTYTN